MISFLSLLSDINLSRYTAICDVNVTIDSKKLSVFVFHFGGGLVGVAVLGDSSAADFLFLQCLLAPQ